MMILNYFLLPEVGLKHILTNSFSNIYLQIWIEPVDVESSKLDCQKKHWSVKWSVLIVEFVLQVENLIILIVVLVGLSTFGFAKKVAR
jgi:hypothetical protein